MLYSAEVEGNQPMEDIVKKYQSKAIYRQQIESDLCSKFLHWPCAQYKQLNLLELILVDNVQLSQRRLSE